jgi:serine/threonine protein kinase
LYQLVVVVVVVRVVWVVCARAYLYRSTRSVLLARKKKTGDVYAIKVLKKDKISSKNQLAHIRNERNILAFASNDFVVKMFYSFQSEKNLYMVMEFLNGGDCFSLLREATYFDEDLARQFIAETVLALKYLHSIGVVHRDMKPGMWSNQTTH